MSSGTRGCRPTLWTLLLVGVVAGAMTASCGLKKRHRCTAATSYLGKVRNGKGDDLASEDKAKLLARADVCVEYCTSDDPEVDAAYRKARDPSKPDDHVGRINVVRNPPVATVFDACKARCQGTLENATFEYSCEQTGL